jgi:hypothetical protein
MIGSGLNRSEVEHMTNLKVASYCQEGAAVDDRLAMVKHFFSKYGENVKTVIYEINPLLFSPQFTAENVYTRFYPYMDEKAIEIYISGNSERLDYIIHKIVRTSRYESRLMISIIRGYIGKYNNVKNNQVNEEILESLVPLKNKTPIIMGEHEIGSFEETMGIISLNKAHIILLMMPMHYIKFQTFDSIGYNHLSDYFKGYCQTHPNVDYIDLNQSQMVKDTKYFSDPLHFNINGQKELSSMISSFILNDTSK